MEQLKVPAVVENGAAPAEDALASAVVARSTPGLTKVLVLRETWSAWVASVGPVNTSFI